LELGVTNLQLRVSINGPGGWFTSTTPVLVSAGSGWKSISFNISSSSLSGGIDYTATMDAVTELRILHVTSISNTGDPIAAQLDIDDITAAQSILPTVYLTALIQGLFNGSTMVSDTAKLELRSSSSPYTLLGSQKGVLSSTGFAVFSFTSAVNGTPYYAVIKHRNGLETWSASGNSFSSSALSYNLTSSQSQAYGGNLIQVGTKWCIYSGDINNDGQVSFTYVIAVDNDNTNFVTGYTATDLTGDGQVTFSDLIIIDNNNLNFVSKIVPSGPSRRTQ